MGRRNILAAVQAVAIVVASAGLAIEVGIGWALTACGVAAAVAAHIQAGDA